MTNNVYDIERQSVEDMFKEHSRYVIPPYQRNYAWDDDNAIQLWDDLSTVNSMSERGSTPNNLLGAMVLIDSTSRPGEVQEIEVVDGQQRLATLSMIFAIIRTYVKRFSDLGSNPLNQIINELVEDLDSILIVKNKPRIQLGDVDKDLFEQLVRNENPNYVEFCKDVRDKYAEKKRLADSHNLLIKNYKTLFAKIELWADENNAKPNDDVSQSTTAILAIKKLICNMQKKNNFAYISVRERGRAYKIFKTFNSLGQQLLQADLIKSDLISKLPNSDQNDIKIKWNKIFNEQAKDPDGLIYESLLARNPVGYIQTPRNKITTDNLFDITDKTCKSPSDVKNYVDELKTDVRFLKNMDYPEDLPDDDASRRLKVCFYGISLLNARYIRVPILAAHRKWKCDAEFLELAECLLIFFFKFRFISEKSVDEIRRISREVSRKINDGKPLSEIIDFILVNRTGPRPEPRISDEEFEKNFKRRVFKLTTKPAKYILASLETHIRSDGHEFDHFQYNFELEHILPRNHQKWNEEEFFKGYKLDDKDIEKFKNRLGNLTLLSKKWNIGVGKKTFMEKNREGKMGYAKSDFQLNQKYLKDYSEWTANNLEARERDICRLATATWSLDRYNKHFKDTTIKYSK